MTNGGILVDPETGTLVSESWELIVSYCEASAGPIGGGPYSRGKLFVPPTAQTLTFSPGGGSINKIMEDSTNHTNHFEASHSKDAPKGFTVLKQMVSYLLIEINDSSTYSIDKLALQLGQDSRPQTLHVRATEGCRPLLRINGDICQGGCMFLLGAGCRLILEGLLIDGAGISVENEPSGNPKHGDLPRRVEIAHSTFVPAGGCCRSKNNLVSLRTNLPGGNVVISSSILAAIVAEQPSGKDTTIYGATGLSITDSIVQSARCDESDSSKAGNPAIDGEHAFRAELRSSTILGRTRLRAIKLAENCLFDDIVTVQRPLEGGMRFCFLPLRDGEGKPSITPRRYYCQPDQAMDQTATARCDSRSTSNVCGDDITDPTAMSGNNLRPDFVSRDYGHPGFGQLSESCPIQIRQGAEDESELGAFHDQFVPQRKALLESRLKEFTPVGLRSFVIFVN